MPIETVELKCAATLVAEPVPGAASAALSWLLPVGSASDPADGQGQSAMLAEMLFRGAGGLDSRGHSDALDRAGVQRSTHVTTHHLRLTAVMVGRRLDEALGLLASMVNDPALPESSLAAVRSLCLQSLDALEDEPQQLVMLRLRERHQAPPFNRSGYGQREVLTGCTIDELRDAWARRCRPGGSILAAAGDVDPPALARRLDELLVRWSGPHEEPVEQGPARRGRDHLVRDTAQVHIGMAYDAPPEADPGSMPERLAVGVLSGGTSARLFTEVRQKRSLCYSVGASYRAGRDTGAVTLYAGTTPQRAAETLDVCSAQIERLRQGVEPEEFDRAVTGLKSRLVMQGESTSARAAALGYDHFRLGRARTLDEIAAAVEAVTLEDLNEYLARRDFGELTIATIGPGDLAISHQPSAAADLSG